MNLKIGLIILISILLIIGGFIIVNQHSNQQQIIVGDISYNLPSGYHVENFDKNNDTLIVNDDDKIFLAVYGKNNVTEYINDYIKYKKQNNTTVQITNFSVNGIDVYKSKIPNDENNTHYWFKKGNKVYSIYSYVNHPNRDVIVMELISSIKDKSFKIL